MTGTNLYVKSKQSRSYLNHLVYFKVFMLLSISPLYNVVFLYVYTIFVPNLEPVSFVSMYDTMYCVLYYSFCFFCA